MLILSARETTCGLREVRSPGRWLDVLVSATSLLLLSPVLLAIAAVVKLSDGGPVLYSHRRVGRGFREIRVCKFRTMVPNADRIGADITSSGDPRVTKIGRILRRCKIDELPQLLNVLRGDMALVGPRPEVSEYVERFRAEYDQLLSLSPGITDPASIEFCNEEAMLEGKDFQKTYTEVILPKKLALSLEYFGRRTCLSDVGVVLRTLAKMVPSRGTKVRKPKMVPALSTRNAASVERIAQ